MKTTCHIPKNTSGRQEFFMSVYPVVAGRFDLELEDVFGQYAALMKEHGLDEESEVQIKIYISDSANQRETLLGHDFFLEGRRRSALMIHELSPLECKIVLTSYHIKADSPIGKKTCIHSNRSNYWNGVIVDRGFYQDLWMGNMVDLDKYNAKFSSYEDTQTIFKEYEAWLERHGANVRQNTVRTWLYVHDIDNHYAGMVTARNEFFKEKGLYDQGRFIASTGIGGREAAAEYLVSMDALAVRGLKEEQIVKMTALSHMNHTFEYNVTFERGLEVIYGDRSHYYISGTASIDNKGEILHCGDVMKQTGRALENVAKLLENSGASLADLTQLVIYYRDFSDAKAITEAVRAAIHENTALVSVLGPVCRPGWLVEMDGIAIKYKQDSRHPDF